MELKLSLPKKRRVEIKLCSSTPQNSCDFSSGVCAGGERRGAECRAVSEAEGLKSSGNYGVDSFQLEHVKEGGGSDVKAAGVGEG